MYTHMYAYMSPNKSDWELKYTMHTSEYPRQLTLMAVGEEERVTRVPAAS